MTTGFQEYHHKKPFHLKYNDGLLPEHTIAYETFGELNEDKSNVVILFTGLSASSHARSHKVSQNWICDMIKENESDFGNIEFEL